MIKDKINIWLLNIGLIVFILVLVNFTDQFRSSCYEIFPAEGDTRQIMLNKCEGKSWMLVHAPIGDESGKKTDKFTYIWMQLSHTEEMPALSKIRE